MLSLDIHTPSQSFTIVHSLTQDTLLSLYDKLTRKSHTDYHPERVAPGWLKYDWNDTIWNLDDDSDYTIFVWRQQQLGTSPVLHLQNPAQSLPTPPAYRNPNFYLFRPQRTLSSPSRATSNSPRHGVGSPGSRHRSQHVPHDNILDHKKKFQQFQEENGVRTLIGSIGPVNNVRMLLRSGYRHVYISRKFAIKHGFVPKDATPGHYGYGGLINIGMWPITVNPVPSSDIQPPKPTLLGVYLSEEQHFDVVLGRSFFERRQLQINSTDPTEVICLDTGERLECELVILKDGKGEILTVT